MDAYKLSASIEIKYILLQCILVQVSLTYKPIKRSRSLNALAANLNMSEKDVKSRCEREDRWNGNVVIEYSYGKITLYVADKSNATELVYFCSQLNQNCEFEKENNKIIIYRFIYKDLYIILDFWISFGI